MVLFVLLCLSYWDHGSKSNGVNLKHFTLEQSVLKTVVMIVISKHMRFLQPQTEMYFGVLECCYPASNGAQVGLLPGFGECNKAWSG